MLAVAERKKIDFQLTPHYAAVSSTDASVFQITRGGMACALLGIPNRYMHSQAEMADLHDVESGIELLTDVLRTAFCLHWKNRKTQGVFQNEMCMEPHLPSDAGRAAFPFRR